MTFPMFLVEKPVLALISFIFDQTLSTSAFSICATQYYCDSITLISLGRNRYAI